MQNKGDILMRKGFSLVTAILFVVLIATLSMFSLNISATTARQTTHIFLREQAELLAQGATEIAVFNLLNTDFTQVANCAFLNANNPTPILQTSFPTNNVATSLFAVTVTASRTFGTIGACDGTAGRGTAVIPISTAASAGTVILDVVVRSANANVPPIRIHRRTIQKL
jgi:hypothetical protein